VTQVQREIQAQRGDTGAKGDTGARGDTGAQSAKGDTGPKGDTGAAGIGADGTITSSIIPDTNNVYSLGSHLYKFQELYVGNNSIFVGDNNVIGAGPSGELQFLRRNPEILPSVFGDTGTVSGLISLSTRQEIIVIM